MIKTELEDWLRSKDYRRDRYGNYPFKGKKNPNQQYRFKLTLNVCRLEFKTDRGDWIPIRRGYISKLNVSAEGKLCGLRRVV